jgi:knotted carbamoyltransferase YgeW
MREEIRAALRALEGSPNPLHNRDFLLTWDHEEPTLRTLLGLADLLERCHAVGADLRVFPGGLAVSNFRDKSTRTRFSFASAASLLGLSAQDLDEAKSQISHGETVRETANMIAFLAQVIGIRDDMYIHEGHAYMREVAAALDEGYAAGVLPQRPAVINLQCDIDHPTQTLADLKHLMDRFGGLEGLRGRKVAMTWAYSPSYGKPLSVPQGIIGLLTRFGMQVVLAHPAGYDLLPDTLAVAERQAQASGGSFTRTHSMAEAFEGAHIVYPKSWASFQVMEERTRLLRAGEADALKILERRCLEQNAEHRGWECTEEMMQRTDQGQALYLHCLPADISGVSCEQGEVAATVFERYRLATYREASHKPYVIAAMILMTRFADPVARIRDLLEDRTAMARTSE